ncbi:DUF4190 domain-containing protein [Bifidobacterium moukalabense]|uniref:Peptidyl-prolyl cis-trans isomerase n=1 Tax=Bifidobacterium moukalabense DSM 27321 TaxID=1435051 RepID=W4N7D3_9BIFI|nr:DUF4190 domain-containing protein [Bifidobacterium moukalabense]ETY70944.1 peptidyl-prolyl cis-trans isomerase [Bifidobacterium moukalabense DSM 27321]
MSDYQNSPAPQQPQDQPTESIPQNFQTVSPQSEVPQPSQQQEYGQPAYAQNPYQQAPQANQPYPPQGVYQAYPQPADQRWNNLCIVGFVLAFFIPLAGLILSIVAMVQINKSGERSKGMAVAGIIISAAIMVFNLIVAILVVNTFLSLMRQGLENFDYSSYSNSNYDSPLDNQDRQELENLLNELESEQQS